MSMSVKEQLHHLVDLIGEDVDSLEEAINHLRWLASDEPGELSEEEWASVREGEAQLKRGDGIPWEEAKRRLGP
jgi:hypothetical protein